MPPYISHCYKCIFSHRCDPGQRFTNCHSTFSQHFGHFNFVNLQIICQVKLWSHSYQHNFCNCVEKPETFSTLIGIEPVRLKPTELWRHWPVASYFSWLEPLAGIGRSQVQTPLKTWEDHIFSWFHICQYIICFIYHFITDHVMVKCRLCFSFLSLPLKLPF